MTHPKNLSPSRAPLFVTCLLASLTAGLFAPLETYLSAASDMWFPMTDLLPVVAVVTPALLAVLLGAGLLTRGRLRDAYTALLLAGSALLYAQSQFLNISYGVLDGTLIQWDSFGAYPVWNALVWLVTLAGAAALALWKRSAAYAPQRVLCAALAAIQLFGAAALMFTSDIGSKREGRYLSTQNEFRFSAQRNAVTVVLDSVSPQLFARAVAAQPDALADWTGFVAFPNSVGAFPSTHFAMRNLLTGVPYDMDGSVAQYLDDSFPATGFWQALKQSGYTVESYVPEVVPAVCEQYFDNVRTADIHATDYITLFKKAYRLAAFRYAPHALKRYFWMSTADFSVLKKLVRDDMYVKDDAAFRRRLDAKGVTADLDGNCFRMYFLQGAHAPYVLDAPAHALSSAGRVTIDRQLLNVLDTVSELFRQMKRAGVYDGATILVTADHGLSSTNNQPFLLVKRPGAQGAVTSSASIVGHADYMATIGALEGLDFESQTGMNVFDAGALRRTFTFRYLPNQDDELYTYDVGFSDAGEPYYVQRDTWRDSAGEHAVPVAEARLGQALPVTTKDEAARLLNRIEADRVEATGGGAVWLGGYPGVTLRARVTDAAGAPLRLRLALADVMNGVQRVTVAMGGVDYHTYTVTADERELIIDVPEALTTPDGTAALELRFPDAQSRYEAGGCEDPAANLRPLAIAVTSATFEAR